MDIVTFVCIVAAVVLVLIGFVCWWGRCPHYVTEQLRNIINGSSEVEISSSDRPNPSSDRLNPPESPIPAVIKYSNRKARDQSDYKQNPNDYDQL